jgi:hypothetical protein
MERGWNGDGDISGQDAEPDVWLARRILNCIDVYVRKQCDQIEWFTGSTKAISSIAKGGMKKEITVQNANVERDGQVAPLGALISFGTQFDRPRRPAMLRLDSATGRHQHFEEAQLDAEGLIQRKERHRPEWALGYRSENHC